MTYFLDAAWTLVRILNFGSLLVAMAGVAIFGWNFVWTIAAAARVKNYEIPAASWWGPRARLGLVIIAAGFALQIVAITFATFLPGRN
jgi:hypothetical protein